VSWTEVESYRQLQREYDAALAIYNQAAAEYHDAVNKRASPGELKAQYETLTAKRVELEALYDKLKSIRSSLAQAQEEAPKKLLL